MKSSDRAILVGVGVLGLVAAFYFLILAPKREDAANLETQVASLQTEVTEAELAASSGKQAKKDFSTNYRKLISLGEAVPVDADTPSLLTQLQGLSEKAGVSFRAINLSAGSGATAAPVDPAAATEASAAALPIGASVGPAGLPVMPYELTFHGGFFQIADFFGEVDGMVTSDGEVTVVDGRLLTIDGFILSPSDEGLPALEATVTTTSYLTPADQGLTAGATPSAPAPSTPTPAATTDESTAPPASAAVMAN